MSKQPNTAPPGDKPSGTMWTASGAVSTSGSYRLCYTIDTAGGQSGSGIADGDACRGVEILPDLPTNEDDAASRHHGLAQIIVELLLGIGILGVELADARVSHWLSKSFGKIGLTAAAFPPRLL